MDLSWVNGVKGIERCYIYTLPDRVPDSLEILYKVWREFACNYPMLTVSCLIIVTLWVITRF
jgi:hypothetical protein